MARHSAKKHTVETLPSKNEKIIVVLILVNSLLSLISLLKSYGIV